MKYIDRTKLSNLLKKNKSITLAFTYVAMLADIFVLGQSQDIRLFGILIIYVFSIRFYKLKSRGTFLLALCILGIMFGLLVFTGTSDYSEKAAVWIFFLIAIGIWQKFKE
jgi:4-hydroxybenzoate polyprenyltransferase